MSTRRNFLKQMGLVIAGAKSNPAEIVEALASSASTVAAGKAASHSTAHWCYWLMRGYLFDSPGEIRFRTREISEDLIFSLGDSTDSSDWEFAREDMKDLRREVQQHLADAAKDMEEARILTQTVSESDWEKLLHRADVQENIRAMMAHDREMEINLTEGLSGDDMEFWKQQFRFLRGMTPAQQKDAYDSIEQQAKNDLSAAERAINVESGLHDVRLRQVIYNKSDGRYILLLERQQDGLHVESPTAWEARTSDFAQRLSMRFGNQLIVEKNSFQRGRLQCNVMPGSAAEEYFHQSLRERVHSVA